MSKDKNNEIDVSQLGNANELNYSEILQLVFDQGCVTQNRTGVDTTSLEGISSNYLLLGNCIPLLSNKKIFTKSLLVELEWYLRGETNIKFLKDNGVSIWDQWADENGDLGPVYGKQWRNWLDTKIVSADECNTLKLVERGYRFVDKLQNGHKLVYQKNYDQLQMALDKLKENPDDRRIIISAWNVGEIDDMNLPPCHAFWQFFSRPLEYGERLVLALTYGNVHNEHDYDSNIRKFFLSYHNIENRGKSENEIKALMDKYNVPTRRLSCALYQRSVDVFIGMPFNIAGYSILTHLFAHLTNQFAETLFHFGGDVHVYKDHQDGINQYLDRFGGVRNSNPKVFFPLEWSTLDDFKWQDVKILDYDPCDAIKVPVAK